MVNGVESWIRTYYCVWARNNQRWYTTSQFSDKSMTDRCPPVLRRCPAGQLSHCGQVILLVNRRDRHGAYRIIQLAFYDFPGSFHVLFPGPLSMSCHGQWIGLCSVLHPRQHSIGYMGDGFYRSKDPTNSIKVLTVEWNGMDIEQVKLLRHFKIILNNGSNWVWQ